MQIRSGNPENLSLVGGFQLTGKTVGLIKEYHIPFSLLGLELFGAAKDGILNLQTGFLPNLPDDAFHEGFTRFHMASGKTEPRPGGIKAILHQNIACTVIDHAEIGKNRLFRSGHEESLQFFAAFGAEI
jgi:hypothetical protein